MLFLIIDTQSKTRAGRVSGFQHALHRIEAFEDRFHVLRVDSIRHERGLLLAPSASGGTNLEYSLGADTGKIGWSATSRPSRAASLRLGAIAKQEVGEVSGVARYDFADLDAERPERVERPER